MKVRVCPNCNSPNVVLRPVYIGDRVYYCKRCHFSSTLFPEIEVKNLDELAKLKLKNLKKINKRKKKGKARPSKKKRA